MLTQENYWMIQELKAQGMYLCDIADRLGVHPKTVQRATSTEHPGLLTDGSLD